MDVFKLRPGDIGDITLTRRNVEQRTQRKAPWFVSEDGEKRYFAVCPSCDNTIQIIRLYDETNKPYGKHYLLRRRDAPGIYSAEHYSDCPYAAKNKHQKPDRNARRPESGLTRKIRHLVISQFDRIIFLLKNQLEMRFSRNMARAMLVDYIAARGWQYGGATPQNIPWIFAYFSGSQPLFGRHFRSKELQAAICRHYPAAVWTDNTLKSSGGYLSPRFCFLYHERKVTDHHLEESITFSVSDSHNQVIFEKKIPVDGSYFSNLAALPDEKGQRKPYWCELAGEVFAEYDE